jgi:hypothetical protein
MTLETPQTPKTLKRMSSAASNSPEGPDSKRQQGTASAMPKVYVVTIIFEPRYGEESTDIRGIYATIKDSNNALKGIVNDEYNHASDWEHEVWGDGRICWLWDDIDASSHTTIEVVKWDVEPEGCEEEREFIERVEDEEEEEESG